MAAPTFTVKGRVVKPDGQPLTGSTVKAFDKDLRQEKLLDGIETDAEGNYTITYTADQLSRPGKTDRQGLAQELLCLYTHPLKSEGAGNHR